MKNLTKMEKSLVEVIANENDNVYPFLKEHIDFLYVTKRENTGVGIYSDFGYYKELGKNNINALVSADKTLTIEGLENEVSYVLDITNGKICFLEIVTNGNDILEKNTFDFKFNLA